VVGGERPPQGHAAIRTRARAHARAPLNTTSATNAHHHAGSVASHNTWLQAWHHRRHQPHRPLPLTTLALAFDHCLPPPHLADPKPCALPVPELLPCLGIGLRLCCCTHVACLTATATPAHLCVVRVERAHALEEVVRMESVADLRVPYGPTRPLEAGGDTESIRGPPDVYGPRKDPLFGGR